MIKMRLPKEDFRTVFLVIFAAALLTVWKYYGSQHFYTHQLANHFAIAGSPSLTGALYLFFNTTLAMLLIPILIVHFGFKQKLSAFGLQKGNLSASFKLFLIATPIMILMTYPSSRQEDFLMEYPYWKQAGKTFSDFSAYSLAYLCFYYIPWEFFFRGFLQFGLRPRTGPVVAILIQTLASCLVHIGKPFNETLSSIIGGLLWGIIAEETGSLIFPILMHWALGASLDFWITFVR